MTLTRSVVAAGLRGLTDLLCRVDDAQLSRVPNEGPLIVITNHVGLVEIPLLYFHLQPRPVSGFSAAVRWENRWTRWLLDLFEAIPLHRGEPDIAALRRGLEVLDAGRILAIMPEGTRSHDGSLQRGHSGVVFLALQSSAPVLPIAHYGSERLADNVRRLRRTDVRFVVGKPFTFDTGGAKVTRRLRQQMVDEAMSELAALLPATYRGVYSDPDASGREHLAFTHGP